MNKVFMLMLAAFSTTLGEKRNPFFSSR